MEKELILIRSALFLENKILIFMFLEYINMYFFQFARQYSKNNAITFNWLCQHIGWPFQMPRTIIDLVHLESVFDVLDLYLWLRYNEIVLFLIMFHCFFDVLIFIILYSIVIVSWTYSRMLK